MGWVNSPPLFCSLTETICDLANSRMYRRHAPPHRQESLAARDDVIDAMGLVTSDSIRDAQVSELRPETQDQVSDQQSGLVNLLLCGWAFCPSHFAPTVKWGPPRNAKLSKH